MKLIRFFFISDDLDDLERFEEDLEAANIVTPQIHVLTLDDTGATNHHHLHQVTSFMKKDIVHSTLIGAGIGIMMAIVVLSVTHLADWHLSAAGWVPFIFLAVALLGFCTWLGGFWGIQKPNIHFKRFEKALNDGKHVFFVDIAPDHEEILTAIAAKHPTAETAGIDLGAPSWIVFSQHRIRHFFTETFR